MKEIKKKVRCNRAMDSICPLKNKCDHFKIHVHRGNIGCGSVDCFLEKDGETKIRVECVKVK